MPATHKSACWTRGFVTLAFGANLLLTVPANAFGLHGDHRPDTKHQIEVLEHEWRTAQLTSDLPLMDRLLSDDYVGITMTGQVNTKAQLLSRMRNRVFVISRLDVREMKVKVVGDVAIVTVRASVQGINEGKLVTGEFRYTRIYHQVANGAWKITNFEATRVPLRSKRMLAVSGDGKAS